MKEYRCTRNALYMHQCLGRDDITARQGHYIKANDAEEAWQKMATRYPDETEAGFTIQEWKSFNVKVVEVKRDEEGNYTKRPAGLMTALKEVQASRQCNMLDTSCVIAVLNNLGYQTIVDWLSENIDKYTAIIDELLQ